MVLSAMNVAMVPDPSYILELKFKTSGSSNYVYSNSEVDKLLDDASKINDQEERFEDFNKVRGIVQNDSPPLP